MILSAIQEISQPKKTLAMKKPLYFLLLLAITLASCTNLKTVRVKKTNFDPETQRGQNLVFTFSHELVSDSGLMNKWDTTTYIKFEPKIPGKFMWTGKSELTFSPSQLLAPSTDFKATLTNAILKYDKKKLSVDDEALPFHTPYISLESVSSYWALGSDPAANIEVRLLLSFNGPVSAASLASLATLEVKGKSRQFRVITQNDSDVIELAFADETQSPDEVTEGKITIGKGFSCSGSNYKTTDAIVMTFTVPSKDKLTITDISSDFEEGEGVISIFTTQPVIDEGLSSLISVQPAVSFTTEILPNGVKLKGGFLANEAYTVKVSPALKSVFGRELGEEFIQTVAFGSPEPYVSFTEKHALYLSTRGSRNLGVNIINIPEVRVSVFKVYENNIQHYTKLGPEWNWQYDENNDEYHEYMTYAFDEDYGRQVMSKVIKTRSLPKSGNISLLNIDLADFNVTDQFRGMYVVKVESADRRWLQDAVMVSLSDLGMIVKEGTDNVLVFVNSLFNASPVKGARVDFYSSNNQKIYSATTDSRGTALFKNIKSQAPGFRLSMVTANYQEDFNFILFNSTRVETSRFDAGGKRTGNLNYDVFLYGDRDLYRPGDTVYYNAIVRDLGWQTVRDLPLKIRILAPNGKEYQSQRKQLSNNGAAEGSFYIPVAAMTGTYSIEVFSSNNILLASRRVAVEEFMPDRIKVAVSTAKNAFDSGESIQVDLQADNLYGTPAAGRKFETELRLSRKNLKPKAFPDYNFTVETKNMPYLATITNTGTTDASGKASHLIKPGVYEGIGILDGTLFTTVFDETGRPVNRLNKIEVLTQPVFLGIKNFDQWVGTRKPMNFKVIAVNKDGKAQGNVQAQVVVSHLRYETVIERDGDRYRYVSQEKESVEYSKTVAVPSTGAVIPFTPAQSGKYVLKVMLPGSQNYVSSTFYAYGWNDTDFTSFEVNREGEVTISADKESYQPGNKAKLLFSAPFDGKMLVTFSRDNVLEFKYIEVKNKAASLVLDISDQHLPNVYIEATLFKKITNTEMPLTVAHGVISLKVDDPKARASVTITAPEKSRSNTRQVITVKTIPNAEVTVAVVDEGILLVTGYTSPDPYAWFYQKRALEVNSYDVYAQLFPELRRSGSSPAGGEAFDLSRRLNPLTSKRVKLISKWSGILKSDGKGQVSFPVDIPQFSGALRVMAVAYKDEKFGSAEKTIRVADPVIVSSALPRFMSPGDKASMIVNVTNTTKAAAKATIEVSATAPLTVSGKTKQPATLGVNHEQAYTFEVTAGNYTGNATVMVTVSALGEKFTEKIELPVRPASGLTFFTGSGIVKGGTSKAFSVNSNLMPQGVRSRLMISKSPAAEYLKNLNDLIRYPYGCMEQTISAAFPQLYLRDLATSAHRQLVAPSESDAGSPDENIQQAIYKVESHQLYNGGFPMWPSGGSDQWWISAYATHFLLEAQKAGYQTNDLIYSNALKYLEQKVKDRKTETYFYTDDAGAITSVSTPAQEIFYSLYVLALADRAAIPTMNFYKSQASALTSENRYLLAAAYMLAGDRRSYQAVLPRTFGTTKIRSLAGYSFASFIRDRAMALNALLEADPDNPQVGQLLLTIGKEMKQKRYLTTQENAFCMTAMGKFARKNAASNVKATVTINGKQTAPFTGSDLVLKDGLNGRKVNISATGNGNLYYFYELSGIPVKPATGDEDHSIRVRKHFLDRNGNALSGNSFRPNDLIIVKITAETESGKTIENVAITDLLPACFEIENSRLVAERSYSWQQNVTTPDYQDIRDDRISFFATLGPATSTFYYTVRVVNKGTYTMGPVTADAMYNADFRSVSGSRVIKVE